MTKLRHKKISVLYSVHGLRCKLFLISWPSTVYVVLFDFQIVPDFSGANSISFEGFKCIFIKSSFQNDILSRRPSHIEMMVFLCKEP